MLVGSLVVWIVGCRWVLSWGGLLGVGGLSDGVDSWGRGGFSRSVAFGGFGRSLRIGFVWLFEPSYANERLKSKDILS